MRISICILLYLIIINPNSPQNKKSRCTQSGVPIYYSVQIASYPATDSAKAIDLFDKHKQDKQLVYYYKTTLNNGSEWIRVRLGCFDERGPALKFAKQYHNQTRSDYFIAQTPLFSESVDKNQNIVVTPNGIWLYTKNIAQPLFSFKESVPTIHNHKQSRPSLSPDGDRMVFYYDHKVVEMGIESKKQTILWENAFDSRPQWSPCGDYIAFMDQNEWEIPASLWIYDADKSYKCLIDNRDQKESVSVKNFKWHPSKPLIYFIEGYTYGTTSIGGSLYSIDIDGNRQQIASANPKQHTEICSNFKIKADSLYYQRAHFDKDFVKIERITKHGVAIVD